MNGDTVRCTYRIVHPGDLDNPVQTQHVLQVQHVLTYQQDNVI